MTPPALWSSHIFFLMKEQFRVVEWTGTTITARAEPRAVDIDLRISLADRSVERTFEKPAHGMLRVPSLRMLANGCYVEPEPT